MNREQVLDVVTSGLLRELEVDYESLANVYYEAKSHLGELDELEMQIAAKGIALDVVRELFLRGHICAGFLADNGEFAPWGLGERSGSLLALQSIC